MKRNGKTPTRLSPRKAQQFIAGLAAQIRLDGQLLAECAEVLADCDPVLAARVSERVENIERAVRGALNEQQR